ncbi:hypothetical protein ENUP19_0205G0017 [Entamoeba nuttalli]|uniref:Activator 1 subunit n=1 Tax=Entamoeba nuttalli TaxID=412467 RepID=A0ABQ0DNX9_9EUKA
MQGIMKLLLKYQPRSFAKLCHWTETTELLYNISQNGNPPHLVIHGTNGSGRYTCCMLFLKEIYGSVVLELGQEKYEIDEEHEIVLKVSPFHVEFNPSQYGLRDRITLQFIIDKMKVGSQQKTLIIHEADKLTKEAQFAVRRAMETGNWRYIFITENISSMMKPLRSRCLDIRIELPTYDEVDRLITNICQQEHTHITQKDKEMILNSNNGNLRTTLITLFVYIQTKHLFKPTWKVSCELIVKTIVVTPNIEVIPKLIRPKLCEFIESGLSPSLILKEIFTLCMNSNIDQLYKLGVVEIIHKFDKSLKQGQNPWIHVENAITALMTLFSAHK